MSKNNKTEQVDSKAIEQAIRTKVLIRSKGKDKDDDLPALLANSSWPKKSNIECPKCGETTVVCCYCYVGSNPDYYYDQYCHVCLNPKCFYGEHVEDRQMVGVEERPKCPWCYRNPCAKS